VFFLLLCHYLGQLTFFNLVIRFVYSLVQHQVGGAASLEYSVFIVSIFVFKLVVLILLLLAPEALFLQLLEGGLSHGRVVELAPLAVVWGLWVALLYETVVVASVGRARVDQDPDQLVLILVCLLPLLVPQVPLLLGYQVTGSVEIVPRGLCDSSSFLLIAELVLLLRVLLVLCNGFGVPDGLSILGVDILVNDGSFLLKLANFLGACLVHFTGINLIGLSGCCPHSLLLDLVPSVVIDVAKLSGKVQRLVFLRGGFPVGFYRGRRVGFPGAASHSPLLRGS